MFRFKFHFFLIVLISNLLFSQKEQIKEIDKLLTLSQKNSKINNQKSLDYAIKASIIAENTSNSEKKAYSYVYIAERLIFLSKPKESLKYIEKSINEDYTKHDILLQAMIKKVKSYSYIDLGFDNEALNENYEILKLLKNEKTKDAILIKFGALLSIGFHYYIIENNNKALEYFNKAEMLLKEEVLKNVNINCELSDLYKRKGNFYLYADKNDSAFFYIKKAYDFILKEPDASKYSQYSAMGDYYFKIANHNIAIDYYLKALKDMKSHGFDDAVYKADIYNRLGISYQLIGDIENGKIYIQRYFLETNLSLDRNKKSVEFATRLIKKENENEQKKYNIIYITLIILLFILLSVGIIRYVRTKKKKNQLLYKKDLQMEQKEKVISAQNMENLQLKSKLIHSIEEIEEMAKNNNPAFLVSFQEKYPKFTPELLEINPNLAVSELRFCALLSLNFTTKEIAKFTFISTKTVENKKTRIRKRLNIPNDVLINIWFQRFL